MSKSRPEWCCPGPEFGCGFSAYWYVKIRWPNGGILDPNFPAENITETYFWAEICFNFTRDTFTINIDFVSE